MKETKINLNEFKLYTLALHTNSLLAWITLFTCFLLFIDWFLRSMFAMMSMVVKSISHRSDHQVYFFTKSLRFLYNLSLIYILVSSARGRGGLVQCCCSIFPLNRFVFNVIIILQATKITWRHCGDQSPFFIVDCVWLQV